MSLQTEIYNIKHAKEELTKVTARRLNHFLHYTNKLSNETRSPVFKTLRDNDEVYIKLNNLIEVLDDLLKGKMFEIKNPNYEPKKFTDNTIEAKQVPIETFYIGNLISLGGRKKGLCPFHSEKSASFVIYPTNTYNCFGCGENGDVIDFVMKLNNIDFKEALALVLDY